MIAGIASLAVGYAVGLFGICPVVKRIWTPSWTLFSGGWCFLFTAGFYAVIDIVKKGKWAFPLIVIGTNSIAAYCMAHLFEGFFVDSLNTHLGPNTFKVFGAAYQTLLMGTGILLSLWLILFWMYRRKIFLRI